MISSTRPLSPTAPLQGPKPEPLSSVPHPTVPTVKPSASLKRQLAQSNLLTEKNQEITSSAMRQKVQQKVQQSGSQKLTELAHDITGQADFGTTRLGKRLQPIHQISQKLEQTLDTIESTGHDLAQTKALLSGDISVENASSASRLLDTTGKLIGSDELSSIASKSMAPVRIIASAKQTKEAFNKVWEEPNLENLAVLGDKAAVLLDDVRETVEKLPGGKALLKMAEKMLDNPAMAKLGRATPGTNVGMAAVDLIMALKDLKAANKNPNPKTVANAALGVVIAVGSLAAASNIPGLSQIGATVASVTELVKKGVNLDIGKLWEGTTSVISDIGSSVAKGVCQSFWGMTSFLGFT